MLLAQFLVKQKDFSAQNLISENSKRQDASAELKSTYTAKTTEQTGKSQFQQALTEFLQHSSQQALKA